MTLASAETVAPSSRTRGTGVMSLRVEDAVLVLKEHRADLRRRLDDLEAGLLTLAETRLWAAPVDITNFSISDLRRKIAEIDDILSRA